MKTLYLDLPTGAAGDMLSAALYELLDTSKKKQFLDTVNSMGLDGVSISAKNCSRCGISGTHIKVSVNGVVEGDHEHHDHHEHDHSDDMHHSHSDMHRIEHIIDSLKVSGSVRENARQVYSVIADAESAAHNRPVTDIHFHEVGSMDAIADIVSVCLLMEMIDPDRVISSPVCTGFGQVRCAHGIMGVPAPATAHILKGVPMYAGDIEGELCTPTGAALIKHFADDFAHMPVMTVDAIGYGMGSRELEAANCVRAFLGSSLGADESIMQLSCNVDDMTGEAIGHALSVFMDEGAKDAFTTPVGMKKSRPGTEITVLCDVSDRDRFVRLMFRHTTTIGIRAAKLDRFVLERTCGSIDTPYGTVGVKTSEGYGVARRKYEFDDICRLADENGISADEVILRLNGENDS